MSSIFYPAKQDFIAKRLHPTQVDFIRNSGFN